MGIHTLVKEQRYLQKRHIYPMFEDIMDTLKKPVSNPTNNETL